MPFKMTCEPDDYEGPWPDLSVSAPAAPQMTDAEMIRTEAWQSITDELAHAAYLRGIDEGKRQATAPQQAGQFDHLAGRGIHELRTGELPAYIVSLAVGHGPSSPVVKAALDWIVSELERKTNDERALAVKLDAIRTAPQQAEPVGYFVNDESDDQWHQVDYEQRNGADTYPLYLHPPADEVQRLRDALKPFAAIDLTTNQAVDAMDVLRARRALAGGE